VQFGSWPAALAYFSAEGFEVAHVFCENGGVQIVAFDPKNSDRLICPQCKARLKVLARITESDFDG